MPCGQKKPDDNLSIPIAIVFAGLLIAGAIVFSEKNSPTTTTAAPSVPSRDQAGADQSNAPVEILALREDDHVLGNPNADVVIIEYSDPECPFCKRFHDTMIQVMDQYGKSGQVAWVYRQFPISQLHPNAPKISEAALCVGSLAGNDAFWKFTDIVVEPPPFRKPPG